MNESSFNSVKNQDFRSSCNSLQESVPTTTIEDLHAFLLPFLPWRPTYLPHVSSRPDSSLAIRKNAPICDH